MSSGTVAAHAHGPLSRTNTAPVFQTRSAGLSQTMSHSSRSSQLSGSTAFTSSSTTSLSSMTSSTTLVPPTPVAATSGTVVATNNIINQRADASRSLYQICVNLRQRLAQVPDFNAHLSDSDNEDEGEDMDPVSSLWRCLRKGTPLMTIYNSLEPTEPLRLEDNITEAKRPKLAAFQFLRAAMNDLKMPPGECFSLQDLFGDDTTGFVKVTQVINHVLDTAEQRGLLLTAEREEAQSALTVAGAKMSYRDHVVQELVNTERKYVQDLENLHELKKIIEQKGVIPGDVVHNIFLNINAILDFQRRFLIKIETTNSQPDDKQEWGLPFANYEEAFGIYQPFIANQRKAASIAKREFDKIAMADHPVVVDFNTLDGFLLKPMQRLVKYPLLLKDMRDKTNASDETKADLTSGIEAANRVLSQANMAVDRELRAEALEDLSARVDDWKNHRVDHFGELLLYGQFPVVTGKSDVQKEVRPPSLKNLSSVKATVDSKRKALISSFRRSDPTPIPTSTSEEDDDFSWDQALGAESEASSIESRRWSSIYRELDSFFPNKIFHQLDGYNPATGNPFLAERYANSMGLVGPQYEQYTIYLFERILLCCKEINPNKSRSDKIIGTQKDKKDKKDKNKSKEFNKNAKLQLKGRIFMTNVTDVITAAKQGSYTVQIFWKGDPGVENFVIRFANDETMRKWYEGIDGQRKLHASTVLSGSSPDTGPTDFAWMRDQQTLANPYAQQEEDDDDDEYSLPASAPVPNSTYPGPNGPNGLPRNTSNTSLRSRSTTGDSMASMIRGPVPPTRFPMNISAPPLTLQTQIASQLPSPGQRVGDSYFSPVAESPATSRSSTASSMFPFPRQGTPQSGWEEHNRYTAPAMPRAPSRGSQNPTDAYQMNGRTQQRPSLPAMALNSQASAAQQRSRSYSTPDIAAQTGGRRLPNGSISGQVPAVPGIPPHLQGHPAFDAGIPRSQNNSPNGLPMRSNTQSPGVQRDRLQQSSYPPVPTYNRSNTTQIPLNSENRTMSPPLGSANSMDSDPELPNQLKVKVNCNGNYVTLVAQYNIKYQVLVDRIDAKVGRFSNNAISQGTMRLRYQDEDGDLVTIESDDDVRIAFQEWREAQKYQYQAGQLGEIELFCLTMDS